MLLILIRFRYIQQEPNYSLLYSSSFVFSMTPTGFSQMLLLHSSSTTLSMTSTAFSLKYCLLYYFNQIPLHLACTQLYLLKCSLLYSSSTVFSMTPTGFSHMLLLHSSSTTLSMTPTAFSLKYCLLYYFNQVPLHSA